MIIFYKTIGNRPITITIDKNKYEMYPEEKISCEEDKNIALACVEIRKQSKFHITSYLVLMAKRLVINVFNMIIMNYPGKWLAEIEPLVFRVDVPLEPCDMEIEYSPVCFHNDGLIRKKPALFINGQKANPDYEVDHEYITVSFWKYCFDLISFWTYAALIVTIVFVLSGIFERYLFVNIIYLLLTAVLVYKKIIKTYIEKQRLCDLLLNQDWIRNG